MGTKSLFSEDRQPSKRTPRGKGKKALMIEAIRDVCGSEEEFLRKVVEGAIGDSEEQIPINVQLMTLVVQRMEPPLKPSSELVTFTFLKNKSLTERALSIIKSIAAGNMPADVGQMIIGMIKDMIAIEESTELKERIEKLEALADG